MKITKIHIEQYARFRDITFDFTYPEGHEKAGQPLEKVCLIGPSGSGKTNLLNLIHYFVTDLLHDANTRGYRGGSNDYQKTDHCIMEDDIFTVNFLLDERSNQVEFSICKLYQTCKFDFPKPEVANEPIRIHLNELSKSRKSAITERQTKRKRNNDYIDTLLLHFASDRNIKSDFWEQVNKPADKIPHVFYFGVDSPEGIWQEITKEIAKYNSAEMNRKQRLANAVLQNDIAKIEILKQELEQWIKDNPDNPVIQFADEYLDPVLEYFGLRVKRNFDENNILDLGQIYLEQLDPDNTFVPFDGWSTGTRNLVLTALPLFSLDPYKAIILIDEPENSLYPDIQKRTVKLYTEDLTNDCQVFFATHSPMIAAEFEPCERFILYFDDEGNVRYRKGIAAEGNMPDEILKNDFQITKLLGTKAVEKWRELEHINNELFRMKKMNGSVDEKEREKLLAEKMRILSDYEF